MSSPPIAGRYDYHLHPDYSIDAEGSMDEFCREAALRGLNEVCFTTHVDTEPEAPRGDWMVSVHGTLVPTEGQWIEEYLADVAAAAAKYAPLGLKVRAGLEIGFHDGVVEKVGRLVESYPLDFVLGSVHMVGAYSMAYAAHVAALFRSRGPTAALTEYFARVGRAAECGLFDCLGHLDLYRRTQGLAAESELADEAIREAAQHALETAAAAGVGIEINARSAAAGPGRLSPGPQLLRIAASAGIKVVTFGSDSHSPATVGANLEVAYAEALRAGFGNIATFEKRKPALWRIPG